MSTQCSCCNRDISENEKETEVFVVCKICNRFTPKNNVKGGNIKMAEKKEDKVKEKKEKKVSLSGQIRELLCKNKTPDEIAKTLNCKKKRVLDTKWLMEHSKKK